MKIPERWGASDDGRFYWELYRLSLRRRIGCKVRRWLGLPVRVNLLEPLAVPHNYARKSKEPSEEGSSSGAEES